jgi:hypothetical protein
MKERTLLTRRTAVSGSIASLLTAVGKPFGEAKAQLVTATGGGAGADLLIFEPSSPQFLGLTQGFNRRWTAPNCAKIFVPLTEAGAQEALTQAVPFGQGKFRVRGGGHCYEDFVFSGDTEALIDMSLLNDIGFDSQNGVYYAQSGGTIWDLYRQLYGRFGRALPAGSCYSVGLGGHVCGGGFGLLSRQFGLTIDWLTGVNVVTVNDSGNTVVNRATNRSPTGPAQDLYWAHTGGEFRPHHALRICRASDRPAICRDHHVELGLGYHFQWRSELPRTDHRLLRPIDAHDAAKFFWATEARASGGASGLGGRAGYI